MWAISIECKYCNPAAKSTIIWCIVPSCLYLDDWSSFFLRNVFRLPLLQYSRMIITFDPSILTPNNARTFSWFSCLGSHYLLLLKCGLHIIFTIEGREPDWTNQQNSIARRLTWKHSQNVFQDRLKKENQKNFIFGSVIYAGENWKSQESN